MILASAPRTNVRDRAMHQPLYRRRDRRPRPAAAGWAGTLAGLACLLAGCTGGPGSPFSAFNPTHKLLDPAKDMRQAAPVPAAVPRELDKRVQPAVRRRAGRRAAGAAGRRGIAGPPAGRPAGDARRHDPAGQVRPSPGRGQDGRGDRGGRQGPGRGPDQGRGRLHGARGDADQQGLLRPRRSQRSRRLPAQRPRDGAGRRPGGRRPDRPRLARQDHPGPADAARLLPRWCCRSAGARSSSSATPRPITRSRPATASTCRRGPSGRTFAHKPTCPCGSRPQTPCPIPLAAPACGTVVEEGGPPPVEPWGPTTPTTPAKP